MSFDIVTNPQSHPDEKTVTKISGTDKDIDERVNG